MLEQPLLKPQCPHFSSGPCAKRPGWTSAALQGAMVGRSHRSPDGHKKIEALLHKTRALLKVPQDYSIGLVPGSATGAMEMALWNLLGPRPVTALAWDVFGDAWVHDVCEQLQLPTVDVRRAPPGELPSLEGIDPDHDVVMTWNGTTTGVCLPDAAWLPPHRQGLVLCDATSALFGMPIDLSALDAIAFSWQKCLGGEAAHGMLILSPRARERLVDHTPSWPVPRLFRLPRDGSPHTGLWRGETVNTPSMLAVEDCLDALAWAESMGGVEALCRRSAQNLRVVEAWVAEYEGIDFLARHPASRSPTSLCLVPVERDFAQKSVAEQWDWIGRACQTLADLGVAFDLKGHKASQPCFRLWGGPTIDPDDIAAVLPWIGWAYQVSRP